MGAQIHLCAGAPDSDDDGWLWAPCQCGWREGPFPDMETAIDALMSHAAEQATTP